MNISYRVGHLRKAALFPMLCGILSSLLLVGMPMSSFAKDGKETWITSGGATAAEEIVRIGAPGTIEEVFVQVGDAVSKGQRLAHTELYSTKLNLDIAKANLEANGTVYQNLKQYVSASIQREQAENAAAQNKNKTTTYQLEYAQAQEEMAKGQYEAQLDTKKVQKIQLDYWESEYKRRIVCSPMDGTISQVLVKPGVGVNYATHVFTIRKEGYYSVLVTVPTALAGTAAQMHSLMIQGPNGGLINAVVDSVTDDPSAPGKNKIFKLLVPGNEIPVTNGAKPDGMKFDVLIPK